MTEKTEREWLEGGTEREHLEGERTSLVGVPDNADAQKTEILALQIRRNEIVGNLRPLAPGQRETLQAELDAIDAEIARRTA